MQTTATSATHSDTRHQAKRGLAIYFSILVPLSALIQTITIRADLNGGENGPVAWILLMVGLMAVPTVASVAARLILREGFADVSFRLGGRQGRNAILLALVAPLIVGSVVYGAAWATRLVGFRVPPVGVGGWVAGIVILIIVNAFLSTGEEVGWRGFMLTRLIDAGVPHPLLVSGLIWGAWHIPLVLWAGYADLSSPYLSVLLLMLLTTPFGYLLARMRLETGSVWPAVALHAAWNSIIQAGFDPITTGAAKALWVGETGILTALVLTVIAVIYSRRHWTLIRAIPTRAKPAARRVGLVSRAETK